MHVPSFLSPSYPQNKLDKGFKPKENVIQVQIALLGKTKCRTHSKGCLARTPDSALLNPTVHLNHRASANELTASLSTTLYG